MECSTVHLDPLMILETVQNAVVSSEILHDVVRL
jgi:hypothetical protein